MSSNQPPAVKSDYFKCCIFAAFFMSVIFVEGELPCQPQDQRIRLLRAKAYLSEKGCRNRAVNNPNKVHCIIYMPV